MNEDALFSSEVLPFKFWRFFSAKKPFLREKRVILMFFFLS